MFYNRLSAHRLIEYIWQFLGQKIFPKNIGRSSLYAIICSHFLEVCSFDLQARLVFQHGCHAAPPNSTWSKNDSYF